MAGLNNYIKEDYDNVQKLLDNKTVQKMVFVPNKIVNFVV